MLDPALVRPGRFDRQVTISPPDRAGRRAILALHATGKSLAADVDLDVVAALTQGFSGADLANVLNESALLAARNGAGEITMAVVEEAVDRATMGVASRGTVMDPQEREMVAYHEAGHALVARSLPGSTPPHKLLILPREGSLGRCTMVDSHDRVVLSRPLLIDHMAGLLGGWVAEKLVFGHSASGVSSDLERVGDTARRMVRSYGMSDVLGPLSYPDEPGQFAGRGACSEKAAQTIDDEVRRLVDEAASRAGSVLTSQRAALDALAAALLERETLTAEDIERLCAPSDDAARRGRAKRPAVSPQIRL